MSNYFSNQAQGIGTTQAAKSDAQNAQAGADRNYFGQNASSYQNYALGAASGTNGGGGIQQSTQDPATGQTTLNGVNPLTQQQQQDLYAAPGAAYGQQGQAAGAAYGQAGQGVAQKGTAGYQGLAQWGADTGGTIRDTNANQMGTAQGTIAGAVDPTKLGLSAKYQQDYQMTPQEIEGMATQAGRTVGNSYQSTIDATHRAAAAAGMSGMGQNALELRARNQSAAQAGAIMADARLSAQLANLGVIQNAESTRLGAEQNIASDKLNQGSQQGALATQQANTGLQVGQFEAGIGQNAVAQEAQLGQLAANDAYTGANSGNDAALKGAQQAQAGQTTGYTQGMGVNQTLSDQADKLTQMMQSGQIDYQQFQIQMAQLQNQITGQQSNTQLGANQQAYNQQGPSALQTILGIAGTAAGAAMKGGL